MGTLRLDLYDDNDETFDLIGLHSTVPLYRLAFFINKYIGLGLKREEKDQDAMVSKIQVNYPVFKYVEPKHNLKMYLVPNKVWTEASTSRSSGSLFETSEPEMIKSVLIKEHVSVDFFIKIEQELSVIPIDKMVDALSKIPAVISSYQVDALQIKQKDYLIFE